MNQELRNGLRRNVQALRETLLDAFRRQLEGTFGILPDGTTQAPEEVPPLRNDAELRRRRSEIEEALWEGRQPAAGPDADCRAVETFVLEAAFTLLNRVAALKLMERRNLVPECLARGHESEGFRLFRQVAPEIARSHRDGGYRFFLELLFDDVAAEIGLLFDRTLPPSHLFPEEAELLRVLVLLNDPEIAAAWDEDETLGWVYQYFTPKELREQVRKESAAPRNTYELAIRNQFYTPDYVVRFLVENTLGRLWWEMKPDTMLRTREYFVLRPGEEPAGREPKDPRELRILDPACGSGHFLHYAFDLLLTIYDEAYEDYSLRVADSLRREYPHPEEFRHAVPSLILGHNLYGLDIDRRAGQLAEASLCLRAKQATSRELTGPINVLIPASESLLPWVVDSKSRPTHAALLRCIVMSVCGPVDVMTLTLGALLKAKLEIHVQLERLREQVNQRKRAGRSLAAKDVLDQEYLRWVDETVHDAVIDVATVDYLETLLSELLQNYHEQNDVFWGGAAEPMRHRKQCAGFLDALLNRYHVVLMNPPFGAASKPSKEYIDEFYPLTKNDVYAAFVERGLELLHPGGYLGAITSRTGFFLSSFQRWREEILLKETEMVAFADLGYGVLDTAMVETAAYALRRTT